MSSRLSVNPGRFDPYKSYKIRLRAADGRYVAGFANSSALTRTTGAVAYSEGGRLSGASKSPAPTKLDSITLEKGVTHDVEFGRWANHGNIGSGPRAVGSLDAFRRDLVVEIYDVVGQLARAYRLYRCRPAEYQAMPELDASANAVAIQLLELENEGYDRC
jgi:phage tail-like protein